MMHFYCQAVYVFKKKGKKRKNNLQKKGFFTENILRINLSKHVQIILISYTSVVT